MPFPFGECDRRSDDESDQTHRDSTLLSVESRQTQWRNSSHRSSRVFILVRGTHRNSQSLVDRRDDILLVGIGEVIKDFRCFV